MTTNVENLQRPRGRLLGGRFCFRLTKIAQFVIRTRVRFEIVCEIPNTQIRVILFIYRQTPTECNNKNNTHALFYVYILVYIGTRTHRRTFYIYIIYYYSASPFFLYYYYYHYFLFSTTIYHV